LSDIGQYLTICTSQLVEVLGRELQSSGPCHIVFLIKIGLNNYLKASNVDRNEPRGFYRHSKLTYFWEFGQIWLFYKSISSLKKGIGKLIKVFSCLELSSLLIAKKNLKKLLYFQSYLTSKLVIQNDFMP
jgi:hypothetical protein